MWRDWLDWPYGLCGRSDMCRRVGSILQSVPGVEVDDQLCIRTRNSNVSMTSPRRAISVTSRERRLDRDGGAQFVRIPSRSAPYKGIRRSVATFSHSYAGRIEWTGPREVRGCRFTTLPLPRCLQFQPSWQNTALRWWWTFTRRPPHLLSYTQVSASHRRDQIVPELWSRFG